MIKNWTLGNFKSVYEETTLEFSPLTIFAGANSSGKSTLIQSILLTAQTLQSPVYSRSVVLNGHVVRLGTYDDIVSNERQGQPILVGFKLTPQAAIDSAPGQVLSRRYYVGEYENTLRLRSIACEFSFSAKGQTDQREVLQLQPRLEHCRLTSEAFIDQQVVTQDLIIRRSGRSIDERVKHYQLSAATSKQTEVSSLEYEIVKPTSLANLNRYYRFVPNSNRPAGASLRHFLPEKLSLVFDAVEHKSRILFDSLIPEEMAYRRRNLSDEDLQAIAGTEVKDILIGMMTEIAAERKEPPFRQSRFSTAIASLKTNFNVESLRACYSAMALVSRRIFGQKLAERAEELKQLLRANKSSEYVMTYVPLPQLSEHAVEYTQQFFNRSVKYLGPLRDEPKPVYPLAAVTDTRDIGYRGEHTASVLELNRNTRVQYIPSRCFGAEDVAMQSQEANLRDAVLDWLQYMGIVSDVQTLDRGKLGHELKVTTSGGGILHDLTHVGVGVSQVLPILVLSLLGELGSVLVFEQPELHLHPRVQTRLADFFVSMTMLSKQCIVETHSEYLINQLRYRAVVSKGDSVSKNVTIYFVEKEEAKSKYKKIQMNMYGVIEDWPKGFFDENEENAARVLAASLEKRRREEVRENV